MNKQELAVEWGEKCGIGRGVAIKMFDDLLDTVTSFLIDGEEVRLSGVGVLYTRNDKNGTRFLEFRKSNKLENTLNKYPIEE